MTIYAGFDVRDKTTHICVVDADGGILRRDVVASDPDALGRYLERHCPKASATHIDRAALRTRAQLITARNAMANQLRGLLKLFGLRMGVARTTGRRAERLTALYDQRPDLKPLFAPLVESIEAIETQLRESTRFA